MRRHKHNRWEPILDHDKRTKVGGIFRFGWGEYDFSGIDICYYGCRVYRVRGKRINLKKIRVHKKGISKPTTNG